MKRNISILWSVACDEDVLTVLNRTGKTINEDVGYHLNERRIIITIHINLNVFSNQRSITDIIFTPKENGILTDSVGFCGTTSR